MTGHFKKVKKGSEQEKKAIQASKFIRESIRKAKSAAIAQGKIKKYSGNKKKAKSEIAARKLQFGLWRSNYQISPT